MVRLLLCLVVALTLGTALLLLRQQRLQLKHQCSALHAEILDTQRVLWRQQVQVAVGTAPAALEQVSAARRLTAASTKAASTSDEWADLGDWEPSPEDWAELASSE